LNVPMLPIPKDWEERFTDFGKKLNSGGENGRKILDSLIARAPPWLKEQGVVVFGHVDVLDLAETNRRLKASGFGRAKTMNQETTRFEAAVIDFGLKESQRDFESYKKLIETMVGREISDIKHSFMSAQKITAPRSEVRGDKGESAGARLKLLRIDYLGMTQRIFAKALRSDKPYLPSTISKWERGIHPVPSDVLLKAEKLAQLITVEAVESPPEESPQEPQESSEKQVAQLRLIAEFERELRELPPGMRISVNSVIRHEMSKSIEVPSSSVADIQSILVEALKKARFERINKDEYRKPLHRSEMRSDLDDYRKRNEVMERNHYTASDGERYSPFWLGAILGDIRNQNASKSEREAWDEMMKYLVARYHGEFRLTLSDISTMMMNSVIGHDGMPDMILLNLTNLAAALFYLDHCP